MKKIIITICMIIISCSKNNSQKNIELSKTIIENEENQFKEIGDSLLISYDFPKHWYNQIYNEGTPMSKNDSINQQKFDRLTFFDNIKGLKLKKIKPEYLENEKNIKLDSAFVFDSLKLGNNKLLYIKVYNTLLYSEYDFPPSQQNVDILFYYKNKFQKKINIYREINYPFSVNVKFGYLNKLGILNTKSFKIDEEGVSFVESNTFNCRDYIK